MASKGCVIGGEGNGGVILPELHYGRDALVGMALILAAMARRGRTLSSLCGELPSYRMIKAKIPWSGGDLTGLVQSPPKSWLSARLDTADGIKALWTDRWVHCRGSGTEPVVRVIAEAPDEPAAQALIEEARACIAGLADQQA
jgi:phosphomannomutase